MEWDGVRWGGGVVYIKKKPLAIENPLVVSHPPEPTPQNTGLRPDPNLPHESKNISRWIQDEHITPRRHDSLVHTTRSWNRKKSPPKNPGIFQYKEKNKAREKKY